MHVVFLLPLVLSIVAAVMFVLGDYGVFTKLFFAAVAGVAVLLQFGGSDVHFLVPLGMQLFVCICWAFACRME